MAKSKKVKCVECGAPQSGHSGGFTGHVGSNRRLYFCPTHWNDETVRVAATTVAFSKELTPAKQVDPDEGGNPKWANRFVGPKRSVTSWGHR